MQETMFNNTFKREVHKKQKIVRKLKKLKQRQLWRQKLEEKMKNAKGKVCRICLGEDHTATNPLISPCKCSGTMSHIHLACLQEWLDSKRTIKQSEYITTYSWKNLDCELCKAKFQGKVFQDGTLVTEEEPSRRYLQEMGQPLDILPFELPDTDKFLVLESVTLQNIRIVHIIHFFGLQNYVRVGRS